MKDVIKRFPKVLLVTATPPCEIYEEMNCNLLYTYTMEQAIKEKYICDYRIYLPWIHEKEDMTTELKMDLPTELESIINGGEIVKDMIFKVLFLIKGMLEKGSRKCIVYLSSIEECKQFEITCMKVMEHYHYISYWIKSITSNTNEKEREENLKMFASMDINELHKIYILCSVRILDECIDIPTCDAVYLTNIGEKTSDIRTVQRICRANRLDIQHPNKIANVFLWCEDKNKIVDSLRLLKENDLEFSKKISLLNGNYERSLEKEDRDTEIKHIKHDQTQLSNFIDVKCMSLEEIWNYKKELLFEYANTYQTHPKSKEIYKGINIGMWFDNQKQKIKKGETTIYEQLSENKYVKEELDRFMEEFKKEKKDISQEEKKELLFEYVNQYKTHPKAKEIYKGIKIGGWFDTQKKKIKKGDTTLYKELSQNKYVKEELDRFMKSFKKE
jgi:superfamily II DNA or RNA helicase